MESKDIMQWLTSVLKWQSTKTGSTPNEGPNKRRRMNNPMSSVDLLSPLFVPVDESDSINGRPAADSARDDSVSRDPRVRPAAQKENTGRATPIIDTNPPPHAPRGPKDMKHTTTKNDTSSKMASKPIQSEGSDPRVICGFLESSLEPRTPPLNSADNENSTAPDDTSANSEPAQSRHEPSGEDNAKKTSMPNPRLVDSSKRENMIKCPLTPTMYNDAGQLRHAVKDLSKYLHVAERRLKELEQFSNKDVWEMAISKLDK